MSTMYVYYVRDRAHFLGYRANAWRQKFYEASKRMRATEAYAMHRMKPDVTKAPADITQAELNLSFELARDQIITGRCFDEMLDELLMNGLDGSTMYLAFDRAARIWEDEK